MSRVLFLLVIFIVAFSAEEKSPIQAHIGIDEPTFDESGNHAGWQLKFSATIDNGTIHYWKNAQETTDYTIPNEKLTIVTKGIAKLAKEILHNQHKQVGKLYRIQFSFVNKSGGINGLYFYDDVNALPKNVSDIVEAIKLLTGNT